MGYARLIRLAPFRGALAAALLGVLLSVAGHRLSQDHEEVRLRADFERIAHDRAQRLQNSLDQALLVLTTVRGLFDASDVVTRRAFHLMMAPALERHPEIMAINWAPRVGQGERASFERRLRAEGLGSEGIYDVTPDARQVRLAATREEYLPVLFSEPMEKNHGAIGIDLSARPRNREAMQQAIRFGVQWSTPPFALVQAPHGPLVVAIYQPVYRLDRPLHTPEERQAALRGVIFVVLRPAWSLEAALAQLSPEGLDSSLLDQGPHPTLVYHRITQLFGHEILPHETLRIDFPLTLPGRTWTLRMVATRGFRERAGSGEAEVILFAGLALSVLLSLLLWLRARQHLQRDRLTAALRASEQRQSQTFETNSAVKLILHPEDGRIVDANSAAVAYYGYGREKLLAMRIQDINTLTQQEIQAEMRQAEVEQRLYFNFRHRLASGENRDVEVYSGPIETPQGPLVYSIIHDVTERRRIQRALQESESRFRQLAENLDAVFWIGSPDWQSVSYVSPAYERIWGCDAESLYQHGMAWFDAVVPEDRAAVLEQIPSRDLAWQGIQFPPYRIHRPDGSTRWISARAYPVCDEHGRVVRVAGIAEDVSERQSYQQHLEELAHFDPLTHLPNRRLLADRLQQALAHGQRTGQLLAICMLDLDGFKAVNDSHGHKAGDELLISVARRLQVSVRGDDTVARLGGDEFVLLLGGLGNVKEVDEALNRLLQVISSPFNLVEQAVHISASIGVTLYPDDTGDADTLLRHADHAMYLAKEAGKNRYVLFNPVLVRREHDNRTALLQIEKAIAQEQLCLYYQPIVDCRIGRVVAMEALLRWDHPMLGLMDPAQFLPLLEGEDDLARQVGAWVVAEALRQADYWRRAGVGMPISVNAFAQQLRDPQFPVLLKTLLSKYPELPPGVLTIEILENTALDDFASVNHLIQVGRELGVHFALDDFGTGFSSLTYLRRLPVDSLKIDQSFVRDMLQDPEDLSIVEGVIGLATAFRHRVIAEGVESGDHALMLMEMGCYLVQGYGIAHPMPGAACQTWLEEFQPDPRWLNNAARRLSRDDFQLVLSEVNHRHWLANLQNWAHHTPGSVLPPLDQHECDFGLWYFSEGRGRYGHLPAFRAAENRHEQVHRLAQELVRLAAQGDPAACRQAEVELLTQGEAFRNDLERIRSAVKFPDAGL